MKLTCVVPAAGMGRRMGKDAYKPLLKLGEKPILIHTLERLGRCPSVNEIVLVANPGRLKEVGRQILKIKQKEKIKSIVPGGINRTHSVYNGLMQVNGRTDLVLIHDGVRPFISEEIILRSIQAAKHFGAAICAVPLSSTIKRVKEDLKVISTINREGLWIVQTPQTFQRELILQAYKTAIEEGYGATDDACMVERQGVEVKVIMGSFFNIKITTPEDLIMAKAILNCGG